MRETMRETIKEKISDGLRSDTFYQNPHKSPFLHELIRNNQAVWGVSMSHVPTESRPGHVALLAGFYEDVSAVTRGWKKNPVAFDSMPNRSSITWAWGSPDIIYPFTVGVDHMRTETYDESWEDFAGNDPSQLDRWVFDRVKALFDSAAMNESLKRDLFSQRSIFFLHLLGLDTNGHWNKPRSRQYIDNVQVVDNGVKAMVQLFEQFYADNRSDHGMTDWGSHGAGSEAEIVCPFVAWGSGIKWGLNGKQSINQVDVTLFLAWGSGIKWGLNGKQSINQVDVTPLMAALLGTAMPMNSVGILPVEMISASSKYLFQAAYANFKQIVEQFLIKRAEKFERSLPGFWHESADFNLKTLESLEATIRRLADAGRWDLAKSLCQEWAPRALSAFLYYHRYERAFLGAAAVAIFVTWMALVYLSLSSSITGDHFKPHPGFVFLLALFTLLLIYLRLPLTNYAYCLLPVYMTAILFNVLKIPIGIWLKLKRDFFNWSNFDETKRDGAQFLFVLFVCAGILFLFVLVFTERWILSILLLILSLVPLGHLKRDREPLRRGALWSICCLVMTIFPLLDTVGNSPSLFLVLGAGGLAVILMMALARMERFSGSSPWFFLVTSVLLISGLGHICFTVYSLHIGAGSPLISRIFAWISLPVAFILPLFAPMNLKSRLLYWMCSLFVPYLMMSTAHEALFYILFVGLLYLMVRMEYSTLDDVRFGQLSLVSAYPLAMSRLDEWRRAFSLVLFILLAFFGTGNVASLNSFNPSFLRCFVTVFSPFTMTALLLTKIAIPFLVTSIAFALLHVGQKEKMLRLTRLILIITDAMTMVFFFQLEDTGSWLDIGISISHYVIAMTTSVIVFALLQLASLLISVQIRIPAIFIKSHHL